MNKSGHVTNKYYRLYIYSLHESQIKYFNNKALISQRKNFSPSKDSKSSTFKCYKFNLTMAG